MKLPWFKKDPRKKKEPKTLPKKPNDKQAVTVKGGKTDLSADKAAEIMRKRNKKMKDMLEEAGK